GILSWTFSVFGVMALLMSAIGLYAVMAFSVSRRTQEMGIRMALGACDKDIVGLVLKKGMTQIGIGMAIGLILGAALSRPLQVLSFRVNPNDPAVYAAIIVTLTLTGVLACLGPALRATRVNIVAALKAE
ncbi:MAG: FtsX-like permease family protein, partial [Gemmatimonadetes bacterium]|nr:FtsX-like permease family protein [Gemmatimonadota bacterium]